MAIRTHQSLSGYVATAPNTDPTSDGTPRFYARAGQRQGRREPDGTYTKLPTQYVPIVAYGDAAEEATALLAKGVGFVAEGRFRPVRYEKRGIHLGADRWIGAGWWSGSSAPGPGRGCLVEATGPRARSSS
ncbi:Single-strand binding protein family protein, partial [Brevibacterium sp. Mu109]